MIIKIKHINQKKLRKVKKIDISKIDKKIPQNYVIENNKLNIPVYYLNLSRSPERNKYMIEQFNKFNINNYHRVEAIDGKNIKRNMKDFNTNHIYEVDGTIIWNNYTHDNLKQSEIACTLSHLKAIRDAYNNDENIALIVEDDTSFELLPLWKKNIYEYMKEFPNDWQCVTLFNQACYIEKKLPEYVNIKDKICSGSVAYVINREGMKNILSGMDEMLVLDKNDPMNENLISDHPAIADIFIFNRIPNCYQRKYPLFYPNNNDSNLDSTIHPHHTWRHTIIANEIINLYSK